MLMYLHLWWRLEDLQMVCTFIPAGTDRCNRRQKLAHYYVKLLVAAVRWHGEETRQFKLLSTSFGIKFYFVSAIRTLINKEQSALLYSPPIDNKEYRQCRQCKVKIPPISLQIRNSSHETNSNREWNLI
jgi:hypothetical protein